MHQNGASTQGLGFLSTKTVANDANGWHSPFTFFFFLQQYNFLRRHTGNTPQLGKLLARTGAIAEPTGEMHPTCISTATNLPERVPTDSQRAGSPRPVGPGGAADRVQTRGATGRPAAHIGNVTDPEGRRPRRSPSARGGFRCHLEIETEDNWGPHNLLPIHTWRKRGKGRVPTSISAKLSSLGSV